MLGIILVCKGKGGEAMSEGVIQVDGSLSIMNTVRGLTGIP